MFFLLMLDFDDLKEALIGKFLFRRIVGSVSSPISILGIDDWLIVDFIEETKDSG